MDEYSGIFNTVASLAIHVDAKNWDELLEIFEPEVLTDYTSLFGGESVRQTRESLIGQWALFLPGFTWTQHIIGTPFVFLEGDLATAVAPVVAWHVCKDPEPAGGDTWIVGGRYEMKLQQSSGRWRISQLKLSSAWANGNLDLPRIATERADLIRRQTYSSGVSV